VLRKARGEEATTDPRPTGRAKAEVARATMRCHSNSLDRAGENGPGSSSSFPAGGHVSGDGEDRHRRPHVFEPRGVIRDRRVRRATNPTSTSAPPTRGTGQGTPPVRASEGDEVDVVAAAAPDPPATP